jgi:hypothetical protein
MAVTAAALTEPVPMADFDQCQLLTVAFGTLGRVLPAALDEVNDFLALDLIDDLGLNAGPCDQRSTQLGGIAAQHENFVELDCFARVSSQTFYPQHIAGLNFVLLAACLDDRKHASSFTVSASCGPRSGVCRALAHLGQRIPFRDVHEITKAPETGTLRLRLAV